MQFWHGQLAQAAKCCGLTGAVGSFAQLQAHPFKLTSACRLSCAVQCGVVHWAHMRRQMGRYGSRDIWAVTRHESNARTGVALHESCSPDAEDTL